MRSVAPLRLGVGLVLLSAVGCAKRPLYVPLDASPVDAPVEALRDAGSPDLRPDAALDAAPDVDQMGIACIAGNEFIYTLEVDGLLSRFDPARDEFFDVGVVDCAGDVSPNSMAIARDGTAWVNLQSGDLVQVSTTDASCMSTKFVADSLDRRFGMSFAETAPGSFTENLWLLSISTAVLESVDLTTFLPSSAVAMENGENGELTGDNDGNLWGFFPTDQPPAIARIDRVKGTLDRRLELPTLTGDPASWGVAAWHQGFYVFLQRNGERSSSIYFVDGTSGAITHTIPNIGRTIVGVGVATCSGNKSP